MTWKNYIRGMKKHPLYFTIHGHFYQPPRENPWTGVIESQPSARPFHDWNDRIASECYSPNAASRILSSTGKIVDIVNNYEFMSFNMGPTLMGWLRVYAPDTYRRIQEADKKSCERLNGHGNAIAQVYNHIILPLATPEDRKTQIRWGVKDFESHFGRKPEAIWLAETAINMDTVRDLIEEGIRYVILSPTQAESFRKIGDSEWKGCANTDIDTTRPYRIFPRDAAGNLTGDGFLDVFFYNPWLSSAVGFEHLLRDAGVFGRRICDAWDANRAEPQLVSIGTDGESYGHHEAFGDMCAAYLYNRYAPEHEMVPVNYGWFLEKFPPEYEVTLKNAQGEGCAWSCAHGVGRWYRDCGCSTGAAEGWNQKWRGPLRDAFNHLKNLADEVFLREFPKISDVNPWDARNEFVDTLVCPEDTSRMERYLEKVLRDPSNKQHRIAAVRLMEIQKYCMFSFTSCGWFFNDIEGLEPVQNMRYALRAIELFKMFLPSSHPIKDQVLSILARAVSNEHHMNGAEVFTRFAVPEVPVVLKLMAENAAMLHLNLDINAGQKNPRFSAERTASRRRQTVVRTKYEAEELGESVVATNLLITDSFGRINIVVAEGIDVDLPFVENPNLSTEELRRLYPTAYVVRLKDLMSDSLQRLNKELNEKHIEQVTASFSNFTLSNGLTIDSLADPGHTLPDTMRKMLSLEISAKIQNLALNYLEQENEQILHEVHELIEEARSLNMKFSFGGTGRYFYAKLSEMIREVSDVPDADEVRYITGLISMADWLHLYINKTALENQAFEIYQRYREEPEGELSVLRPMFDWLNFE